MFMNSVIESMSSTKLSNLIEHVIRVALVSYFSYININVYHAETVCGNSDSG